ncbi:hypothetical protein [Wolbachia endosymbiont (group A) of Rhorus exstirpatorius]|uniref:hypothetical protein n=1 Tax=Wolbachia endosymbiont (group A) of Rhorus exstirpatorius TaxID=3066213 RepID=UPI00333EBAA0
MFSRQALNAITQVLRAQLSEKYSELSNMTKELRNLENIKDRKNDSGYYSRTDTPITFLDSIFPRSTLNKATEYLTSYKKIKKQSMDWKFKGQKS